MHSWAWCSTCSSLLGTCSCCPALLCDGVLETLLCCTARLFGNVLPFIGPGCAKGQDPSARPYWLLHQEPELAQNHVGISLRTMYPKKAPKGAGVGGGQRQKMLSKRLPHLMRDPGSSGKAVCPKQPPAVGSNSVPHRGHWC